MKDYTVKRCNNKFEKVKSIKNIIELNEPTLSIIKRHFGTEFVQAYISSWIVNLNGFLNLKYSMSEQQIEETARLIIINYYNLSVADVYLIMNNAKMGLYGKFYDRIDGSMILRWFKDYFNERCDTFESQSIRESDVLKNQTKKKIKMNSKTINKEINKKVKLRT